MLVQDIPVMRTFPVDIGATWTSISSAVDQVREPSERHNADVAALTENAKGIDVTPKFLVHLTFNHCGDSVMKLMGRDPELHNLHSIAARWCTEVHTHKGGEFKLRDLESCCTWRGIVHTFNDTAAHQSNGVVERRIGLLNHGV